MQGKLTKLGHVIMSALIVIEVHACDVVAKMLEEGVQNGSHNCGKWLGWVAYGVIHPEIDFRMFLPLAINIT